MLLKENAEYKLKCILTVVNIIIKYKDVSSGT